MDSQNLRIGRIQQAWAPCSARKNSKSSSSDSRARSVWVLTRAALVVGVNPRSDGMVAAVDLSLHHFPAQFLVALFLMLRGVVPIAGHQDLGRLRQKYHATGRAFLLRGPTVVSDLHIENPNSRPSLHDKLKCCRKFFIYVIVVENTMGKTFPATSCLQMLIRHARAVRGSSQRHGLPGTCGVARSCH